MNLTTSELATILAALRTYQHLQHAAPTPDVSSHFADCDPLSTSAIDSLCERLNLAPSHAYYKVRPTNDNLSFIAWAALVPLTTEDPHNDPAEPVHFQFAATPDLAASKLHEEMDAAYGKRTWVRQHSDTDSATKAMLRKVFNHFDQLSTQSDDLILDGMRRWRDDHESLHRLAENALA